MRECVATEINVYSALIKQKILENNNNKNYTITLLFFFFDSFFNWPIWYKLKIHINQNQLHVYSTFTIRV